MTGVCQVTGGERISGGQSTTSATAELFEGSSPSPVSECLPGPPWSLFLTYMLFLGSVRTRRLLLLTQQSPPVTGTASTSASLPQWVPEQAQKAPNQPFMPKGGPEVQTASWLCLTLLPIFLATLA